MTQRTVHLFAILALLASCQHAPPSQPVPADYDRLPFAPAGNLIGNGSPDVEPVYLKVLQFYRPTHSQVRRLEDRMLPIAVADTGQPLDPALAARLVQQLGSSHYCFHGTVPPCISTIGGGLVLSAIQQLGPDRVRVAVHYIGDSTPYASGTAFSGTEVFLLERDHAGWRIVAHAPARP